MYDVEDVDSNKMDDAAMLPNMDLPKLSHCHHFSTVVITGKHRPNQANHLASLARIRLDVAAVALFLAGWSLSQVLGYLHLD